MDFFDVARICAKRWYVFLPLLLVTAWYTYSSYTSVKPVYYVSSVVSIAPPNQRSSYSAQPAEVNGLLEAGGPTLITNLAVIAGNDSAFIDKVAAAGGQRNFVVKNFPTPFGVQVPLPLIMLETYSGDSYSAIKTIEIAATQIDGLFSDLQRSAGVADSQMAHAIVASAPKSVQAMPSRNRSAAGKFLGGLGIAVLASVVTDGFVTRVQRGKKTRLETQVITPVSD